MRQLLAKKRRYVVLALALLIVPHAYAGPERGTPQYGGTVNILTSLAALNALSFNQYNFVWKTNHDGLYLEYLAKGDLNFGPRGTGENSFKSLNRLINDKPIKSVISATMYWPVHLPPGVNL